MSRKQKQLERERTNVVQAERRASKSLLQRLRLRGLDESDLEPARRPHRPQPVEPEPRVRYVDNRDLEVVQVLDDHRRASAEVAQAGSLPAPAEEPPVCIIHDWPPANQRHGRQPRPEPSLCPGCRDERQRLERERANPRQIEVEVQVPAPTVRMDVAWAAHLAEVEAVGEPVPGSAVEEDVLAYMDEQRNREHSEARGPYRAIEFFPYDGSRRIVVKRSARARPRPAFQSYMRQRQIWRAAS